MTFQFLINQNGPEMVFLVGTVAVERYGVTTVRNMTEDVKTDVMLRGEHLLVGDQLVPLLKCPFCNFKNVHEEEITHHIMYKEDAKHNVDVDKINKKQYIMTKKEKESRYHYESKEDLPLPSIKCHWCDYSDKVERDLEYHFLEKHKDRLYKMKVSPQERRQDPVWTQDPYSWMYDDIEYRLYKAIRLAKRKTGIEG